MRFGVLGPLAVWTDGGDPVRVPELKVRLLLAGLLADPGRLVPADRLVEHLWGGDLPANPAASLQTRASQLRRALGEAEEGGRTLLVSRPPGYLLDAEPGSVDSQAFHELLARARAAADPSTRAALLADALALWRGPAFGDFADHEFTRAVTTRLEDQRLTALEEQAEIRVELGEHDLVADELGDLIERHPLRERMRAAHMRALYRSGRQSEALDSYHRLRAHLADELGLDPGPGITELYRAVLTQELGPGRPPAPASSAGSAPPAAPTALAVPRPGLPEPATSLVGRDAEADRVVSVLDGARLVTLTGSGGVGKTRLALAVAARATASDGVRWVDLSGLGAADPDADRAGPDRGGTGTAEVVETIAAGLGVRDDTASTGAAPAPVAPTDPGGRGLARLAEAVRSQDTLLVLDNCEHLVAPVAEVIAALLNAAPGLRVLVTSQAQLALAAEHVWQVRPLSLPAPGADTETARGSDAVRLFVERAAATSPGFALTDTNTEAVTAICRHLDGVPLALELAATRVRSLGVHALAERIDDRFSLLSSGYRDAPNRQRTLRAVIDWSWDLLSDPERAVLRRLSVHAEGCTLAAAEAVCSAPGTAPGQVMDLLADLVDRSLVAVTDHPSGPRYRLLESVSAYGLERLREVGEEEGARTRHLEYYLHLAERADPHLRTAVQRGWLDRLDTESANLRRALATATAAGASDHALRLADALAWYWLIRGRLCEGSRALASALALDGGDPDRRRTARLWRACLVHGFALEPDQAEEPEEPGSDTVPASSELRARWFLMDARTGFSPADHDGYGPRLERLAAEFEERSDPWGTAAVEVTLARRAFGRSDLDALRAHAVRGAALFAETGDGWGQALTSDLLGTHAEVTGEYAAAARHHREGLRVAEGLGLWTEMGERLISLGRIALLEGDLRRSEELHERARLLSVEHGHVVGEEAAVLGLGMVARRRGDLDTARSHLEAWLGWHLRMRSDFGASLILAELGFAAELGGDPGEAEHLHLRGLEAARRTGDPRAVALALEGLAGARVLGAAPEHAVRLLGAAEALRASVGAPLPEAERGDVDRVEARIAAALAPGPRERARAHGRTLDLAGALAEAENGRVASRS
ncbi:AfsR/SARP family transcriptional regulator [Nocardiopsis ganjiahuensis]|uniref:AfsR/SARP family transcriptional regulator n=1 Tax=Nocardiopsis ganjiahuensis TaxID=239984 RepID=UPI000370847C|nr:BTAD domain-containing putative transcriptional regulator [Nocardiopsis ganjiahuensis]